MTYQRLAFELALAFTLAAAVCGAFLNLHP